MLLTISVYGMMQLAWVGLVQQENRNVFITLSWNENDNKILRNLSNQVIEDGFYSHLTSLFVGC